MSKRPQLEALRKELLAEKAKILEVVAPARTDYERLVNAPRLIECRNILKANNARLFEIDNELAGIARAIGTKTLSGS